MVLLLLEVPVGLVSVPVASPRLSLLLLFWLPLCKEPLLDSSVLPNEPEAPELFMVPLCVLVPDWVVPELLPEVPD